MHNNMNEKELSLWISKISSELNKNSKEIDCAEIFRSYNTLHWENWIKDIINLKIAYPLSRLSADGDIIIDIVDYLRKNVISSQYYEEAISNLFIKEYHQNEENVLLIERLIRALISLSSYSANETLMKILFSKINSKKKGNISYIKTISLLALSKSAFLSTENIKEIYHYIVIQGFKEMKHDPYFYSTALRFCYLKISLKAFFETLTLILKDIDLTDTTSSKDDIIHLLVDKIEEIHYAKLHIFYTYFFSWLLTSHDQNQPNSFCLNPITVELLNKLGSLINKNLLDLSFKNEDIIEEVKYKNATEFLLSIIIEKDISPSKVFENPLDLVTNLVFITKSANNLSSLLNIIESKVSFITKTKMRLIPSIIEEDHYSNEGLIKIINFLDKFIYSPKSNIQSSKESINNLLSENYG